MTAPRNTAPKLALALAGGGPLGAIYEVGTMCALEESLQGLNFNHLHHYIGVSVGSFIAAALANGMSPLVPFDTTAPQFDKVMQRGMPLAKRKSPRIIDGGLYAKLVSHGIRLNYSMLNDTKRHLCLPKKVPTELGRAMASLQELLDDLGHLVVEPTATKALH